MDKNRGKLIVIEGLDGSGKGTVVEALRQKFAGDKFLFLREPGGTDVSEKVRDVLLNAEFKAGHEMTPMTEMLLFYAARAQLVSQVIKSALIKGTHVILDRADPSTFAFQVRGHKNHKLEELFYVLAGHVWDVHLDDLKAGKPIYDLVICLDVPARIGQERVHKSRGSSGDRIEQRAISYHDRVRRGYFELSNQNLLGLWKVIDARRAPSVVCREVVEAVRGVVEL